MIGLLMMVGVVLSGCAPVPLIQRIPFPSDEYAALATTGTGVVKGQAFMKTRGGEVRTAAGNEIHLDPVTTYSMQREKVGSSRLTPIDPRYREYFNSVDWGPINWFTDAEGKFELENIPPGEYYIMTSVTWEAPVKKQKLVWDPYGGVLGKGAYVDVGKVVLEKQGGQIVKRIEVKNGETTIIMLTD